MYDLVNWGIFASLGLDELISNMIHMLKESPNLYTLKHSALTFQTLITFINAKRVDKDAKC